MPSAMVVGGPYAWLTASNPSCSSWNQDFERERSSSPMGAVDRGGDYRGEAITRHAPSSLKVADPIAVPPWTSSCVARELSTLPRRKGVGSEGRIDRRLAIPSSPLEESSRPLVTVVIPTRDRLASLTKAISSALAQDHVRLEVVVVDDGSEMRVDGNLDLTDERIRVVRIDQSVGPAMAREKGISEARGTIIAYLDDDDYWLAGKLERSIGYFRKYPQAGVVFHQTGQSPDNASDGGVTYHHDAMERMVLKQPPSLDGVLVQKSVHSQVGFDSEFAGAEDLDYMIGLAKITPMVEIHQSYAVIGDSSPSSFVGVEKRIQGRELLRKKHRAVFEDRRALAFWYLRFGHLNRIGGHRLRSFGAFVKSAFLQPLDASAWKGMVMAFTPRAAFDLIIASRSDR